MQASAIQAQAVSRIRDFLKTTDASDTPAIGVLVVEQLKNFFKNLVLNDEVKANLKAGILAAYDEICAATDIPYFPDKPLEDFGRLLLSRSLDRWVSQ